MNSSLDLNLLLIARQSGGDKTELPDLYAVTPPRKAVRGREADSLIIYLSLMGNSPLSTEAHTQLLEQLAQKFYKTTGSLTSALRTIADGVNLYLLDRNLRSTNGGRQGIGQLLLVALRADTVYMAQCGAVHAYLITPTETQHLYDPQGTGRGLGLSRSMPIRFVQLKMEADEFLVLSTIASPVWSEDSLKHPHQQGIEALRNQLIENGGQNFNAVIIQAQAGTGKLRLLRRKADMPAMVPTASAEKPAVTVSPTPSAAPAQKTEGTGEDHKLGIPSSAIPEASPVETPVEEKNLDLTANASLTTDAAEVAHEDRRPGIPPSLPSSSTALENITPVEMQPEAPTLPAQPTNLQPAAEKIPYTRLPRPEVNKSGETVSKPVPPSAQAAKTSRPAKVRSWAKELHSFQTTLAGIGGAILRALRSALGTIGTALLRLLKSLLPDTDVLRLPPSLLIFVAIAIPLILAVTGGMVFLQRGRAEQQQVYYKQAVDEAAYAATLKDPVEQRLAWQTVIADLDKAEYYETTSQSQALRAQVAASLDDMEAIKRLDYQQAIVGGLDSGVNITRIVATTTDLYLLNGKQGNVLHAILTGQGYVIDPNFQCGPTYGPINVGPLIDIAELPQGSFENASLLGMDINGNLLYCIVGSQPYSAAMAPPNTGFGEPIAMSLDQGDLFVLDPSVNAVWIYRNMEVSQQPRLFFGDTIPPMQDVIDLAVYNDDLFMLHADGHTTKCTYSAMTESPTRCDDPYPYSDNRPGRRHGPTIEDAVFNQIYFLSFPERSIFMMDPKNQAVYYFSVLLTLQWQYQPKEALADGKATAFAISPNRTAFLAVGNYVYYAAMP